VSASPKLLAAASIAAAIAAGLSLLRLASPKTNYRPESAHPIAG
jgi:hypothetical protein